MEMSKSQHLIGNVLGSCVLEKLLGYGESSAVFLAQQRDPERKVAIKVFLPHTDIDTNLRHNFYLRFLHEAEAASKLDHPNILPIYAYGEQDGIPYIVMPYMEGGTLSEYMTKHDPLSLLEAQWYLEQIAGALDYAHTHGCVHCDVKPANLLLDGEGHIMLFDFGISRVISPDEDSEQERNEPLSLIGTPDYISPEQAMGKSLDGRSDIYSLGVTLFYLLTGQLPFTGDTAIALALLHIHEKPPSLAFIRTDITISIDQVIHRALAKHPKDRFQTATAFSRAFADAVAESKLARQTTVNIGTNQTGVNIGNNQQISISFPTLRFLSPLYNSIGKVFSTFGFYTYALKYYDRALSLASYSSQLYINKGEVLFNLKRYKEALSAYDEAIRLAPDSSKAYRKRGKTFEQLALQSYNEFKRYALQSYEKAKELGVE